MNKINIDNWKEFAMSDLGFKNYHGKRLKKSDRLEGDIPFITAGKENQGVVGCIGNDMDTYENPITIDMFGNVFYHEGIFAGDDNIYFFVNPKLNKYQKLFIVGALHRFIHSVFAYIDQFRQDNADRLSVFLPSTQSGEPDFQYMEEYIKNVEKKQNHNLQIIKLLIPPPDKNVNTVSWGIFQLSKLFDVKKGTRLTKANMIDGNINFIGASAINNGVTAKINNNTHIHPANTITVSYNGSVGATFYQAEYFWASDDVNVLYPKFKMNQQIAFFIIPIIKQLGKQYAFIDKWKKEDMEKTFIPLPMTLSGEPDFQYMEQTITALIVQQQAKLQRTQTTFA